MCVLCEEAGGEVEYNMVETPVHLSCAIGHSRRFVGLDPAEEVDTDTPTGVVCTLCEEPGAEVEYNLAEGLVHVSCAKKHGQTFLAGRAAHMSTKRYEKECEECGRDFTTRYSRQVYCDKACARRARRSRAKAQREAAMSPKDLIKHIARKKGVKMS